MITTLLAAVVFGTSALHTAQALLNNETHDTVQIETAGTFNKDGRQQTICGKLRMSDGKEQYFIVVTNEDGTRGRVLYRGDTQTRNARTLCRND